jgi:transcription-repair coupling factor (superfamily II helicase)
MYCRLLRQTVEHLRHDPEVGAALTSEIPAQVTSEIEAAAVELELGVRAYLPEEWIPTAQARLEALRQLSAIQSEEDAARALAALRDRFGRVPREAEALVRQFALRARCIALGIARLSWRGDTVVVGYADRLGLERALAGSHVELRAVRSGLAHLVVPRERRTPEAALEWLERLLKGGEPASKMVAPGAPR